MNALENASTMDSAHHHPVTSSGAAKIISFFWHLLQMGAAMEAGMLLYMLFANQLAPDSYRALTLAYPLFDFWMMMAAMTVPMIVLMWYHKYDLRYCIEMTIAMLGPVVFLTLLTQLDLMSLCSLHCNSSTVMFLGMAVYLFYRRH